MKKSFFAKEIQRQLDHKCYHPIWHMMHKIRSAMGEREGEYMLAGRVELDDGCFFTEVFENEKDNLKSAIINEQVKTIVHNVTMSSLNFYKSILMSSLTNSIGGTSVKHSSTDFVASVNYKNEYRVCEK